MHVPCAKYGAFVSQRVAKPHAQERPQALELRVSRTMACSIVLPHRCLPRHFDTFLYFDLCVL